MTGREGSGFFRGSELTRLMALAAIGVIGWSLVLWFGGPRAEPPPLAPPPVDAPPPPPPDDSPPFAAVKDKTPIDPLRENVAYAALLKRVRETPPTRLAAQARRDIVFAQLWDNPGRYRGVPVHIEGTARRCLLDEVKTTIAPKGRVFEAWVFTPESQRFPYVLVFEDSPKGFPGGHDINEQVAFDGYFFKLLAYQAADVPRAAPLLIGRLSWRPHPTETRTPAHRLVFWTLVAVGVMAVITAFRWVVFLRYKFSRTRPVHRPGPLVKEIESDELAEWLDNPTDEPWEDGEPPEEPTR